MSRHRDKDYFRPQKQLVKMLYREIARQDFLGWATSKSNARMLLSKIYINHPSAEWLVLYATADRKSWIVVPIGPQEDIKTLDDARGRTFDGKAAVAYSPVG